MSRSIRLMSYANRPGLGSGAVAYLADGEASMTQGYQTGVKRTLSEVGALA